MAQFNSGYTPSEIMAMQRDAEKRVREMQKKSVEKLKGSSSDFISHPVKNILKSMDKDRLILLCLFLLLMEEDSDPVLLLALAYIFF